MKEEHLPAISLALITLVVVIVLRMWQRSHTNFDLSDLLTGDNGRVSLSKFGQATALVVSTWGFVIQVEQGTLTETYFGLYMAIWATANTAKAYIAAKGNQDENKSPVV